MQCELCKGLNEHTLFTIIHMEPHGTAVSYSAIFTT